MDNQAARREGQKKKTMETEHLEKELSCPVCLDVFSRPVVILPCQHNLCQACAQQLYQSNNRYHRSGGTFRCPTCRYEAVLDRHGVSGLQRNLLVENIIDTFKQLQTWEGRGLKEEGLEEPRCTEHRDERINIYCVTCQTPTCSMCKVFGEHRDCQVSPLRTVHQNHRNQLKDATERLAAGNTRVQDAIAKMDDTCKQIRDNGELQKRRLSESLDLLFAAVEQRRSQLLERLDQEEQEEKSRLRAEAERHKVQLQLNKKLQEKLQLSVQSCSATELLLTAPQLHQEAQQLQQEAQQLHQEAQLRWPEPRHRKLDTHQVEVLLRHMDFRQDEENHEPGPQLEA